MDIKSSTKNWRPNESPTCEQRHKNFHWSYAFLPTRKHSFVAARAKSIQHFQYSAQY